MQPTELYHALEDYKARHGGASIVPGDMLLIDWRPVDVTLANLFEEHNLDCP